MGCYRGSQAPIPPVPHHPHLQDRWDVRWWSLWEPRTAESGSPLPTPLCSCPFVGRFPAPSSKCGRRSLPCFPITLACQHLEEISMAGKPGELIVYFLFNLTCKKTCRMRSVPALSPEIRVKSTEKCSFITTLGFPVLNLTCSWQTLYPGFITLKDLARLNPLFSLFCPALFLLSFGHLGTTRASGNLRGRSYGYATS